MNKSWYLYIAKTKTNKYYTGISTNPTKRIIAHNRGYGAKFAINQGPFILIYVSQSINSKKQARKLEIKIKNWSQKRKRN